MVCRRERLWAFGQDLFKSIPESLRSKALGGKLPQRGQDGSAIPIGHFSFRTGLADAVQSGEQQVMSGRGSGAWSGPKGGEQVPHSGLLSGRPQGGGQAKIAGGSGQGDGGGTIADHLSQFLGGAQVGLMDDTRLAFDAGTFDHGVIEFVAFFLRDEARHNRVIQSFTCQTNYVKHLMQIYRDIHRNLLYTG